MPKRGATAGKAGSSKRTKVAAPPAPFKPPANWEATYELIKAIRDGTNAPVDEVGAHALPEAGVDEETRRYQALVGLQLSSQTRDQQTKKAMVELQKPPGLTVEAVLATSDDDLREKIRSVGFYNKKVGYLKKAALILKEEHNGLVPRDVDALMRLPGVGPKMAHLTMQIAFDVNSGIAVDTHLHRIANQLKWANASNPLKTMQQLESWFPREEWFKINFYIVGLGQMMQQRKKELYLKVESMESREEGFRLLRKLGFDVSGVKKKYELD